jgi:hypothetical protein
VALTLVSAGPRIVSAHLSAYVRDEQESARITAYIESNPVKAGLVERAEDYRWSSADQQKCLDTIVETADTSVRATKA